ncbi:VMAP-C domain-containing protein [Actinomadura sp. WAC 06369]|uniref:VMAP-C domain-containing protein n=1 Tax=Actinomadura sp. WAC 06369 TaxID=2203193 RepID=UPI000F7693B9|nr:hypothetical protein [Actinomadura sp. WAC 06369]RSN58025.1 hypothetical protein DMH08_23490 [Actinomadura sp. WAC 06369]
MASGLSQDDVKRLVEALWRLDALQKQSVRDLYLSIVRKELGIALPVRRDERDFQDLWGLVEGCLEQTGAFHAFLQVVERFHTGNSTFEAVRRLGYALVPEPLLEAGERRVVHELLKVLKNAEPGALRPEVVRDLFWTVAEPPGSVAFDTGDVWPVLDALEEFTVDEDGVPPLLNFVERLAVESGGPVRNRLLSWVERAAERLGVAYVIRARRERAARVRERPRMYLVIACRPDGVTPDEYLISAWLQSEDGHGVTLRCDDERPMPVTELPALVAALLTEDPQVVNRPPMSELTLEFVLPLNLLGVQSLDQLRITVDGLERRLGIEHPVVVRSLDRIQKPNYHPAWRRMWSWLRENPHHAEVCLMTQPGEYLSESLYSMLLSDPPTVCLALAFPPRADGAGAADELRIALQAGAPVIAWCRGGRTPDRYAMEIRELTASGVMALPDSVLKLRREAVASHGRDPGGEHLGLQLTLLFDDADRFPEPHGRLKAPAQ